MVHERHPVCLSALNNLLFVSTFHSLFFNPVILYFLGTILNWISDNPAAVNIEGELEFVSCRLFLRCR